MLRKVRLIASVVLLCAVFLPLSECSQGEGHPMPKSKSVGQELYPQSTSDVSYQYAYRTFGFDGWTAFTIIAFLWPAVFLLLSRQPGSARKRLILRVFEILLCAGSIYWVNVLTYHAFGATWLYGAYIAVAAVFIFTLCGIVGWLRPPSAIPEAPFFAGPA